MPPAIPTLFLFHRTFGVIWFCSQNDPCSLLVSHWLARIGRINTITLLRFLTQNKTPCILLRVLKLHLETRIFTLLNATTSTIFQLLPASYILVAQRTAAHTSPRAPLGLSPAYSSAVSPVVSSSEPGDLPQPQVVGRIHFFVGQGQSTVSLLAGDSQTTGADCFTATSRMFHLFRASLMSSGRLQKSPIWVSQYQRFLTWSWKPPPSLSQGWPHITAGATTALFTGLRSWGPLNPTSRYQMPLVWLPLTCLGSGPVMCYSLASCFCCKYFWAYHYLFYICL